METPPADQVMERPTWFPSARQLERDSYRQSRTRRSVLVSTASTLVVIGLLAWGLLSSPGWSRVKASFFNFDVGSETYLAILNGLWLNVRVMIVCEVIILAFGLALALARTVKGPVFFPLRAAATIYTDVFRGLPLILVLLITGFAVPGLRLQGIPTDPIFLGGIALVLTYSAYVGEVFRAGIESIHPSQWAAARSLGLTRAQTLRRVVLPQAVRRVFPPLLNDLVSLQKDSGLISILGVVDAVRAAQIAAYTGGNFTPYVIAGILFVALTIPMTRVTDYIARKRGWVSGAVASAGGVA